MAPVKGPGTAGAVNGNAARGGEDVVERVLRASEFLSDRRRSDGDRESKSNRSNHSEPPK